MQFIINTLFSDICTQKYPRFWFWVGYWIFMDQTQPKKSIEIQPKPKPWVQISGDFVRIHEYSMLNLLDSTGYSNIRNARFMDFPKKHGFIFGILDF
jgi:hypothetical protein